jgi:hypothetical protein
LKQNKTKQTNNQNYIRFATILLYFTDLGEMDGGETVFTEAWPHDIPVTERKTVEKVRTFYEQSHKILYVYHNVRMQDCCVCDLQQTFSDYCSFCIYSKKKARQELRQSAQGSILEPNSWEETMVRVNIGPFCTYDMNILNSNYFIFNLEMWRIS